MEIGPYRVTEDQQLRYNNGSWDEFANVLFVDNPVGTGFSYVNTDSYVTELTDMADQIMIFLQKFFALFPEYEDNDVSLGLRSKVSSGSSLDHSCTLAANHTPDSTFLMSQKQYLIGTKLLGKGGRGGFLDC